MIEAENVSVLFKRGLFKPNLKALDGFSLKIREGDFFALVGPNGAGKSTAMYCLLGLIQPDSGKISIGGTTPTLGSEMFKEIAYLPEEPHYHLYLTVEEAVGYYASLYGRGITKNEVNEAIERVGLAEYKDLRLSKCSKGMKQKAGIAQCLVNSPKILFLDEPTRGLDPVAVKEFRDILLDMNKGGSTIVLNSHHLSEVEMICNRVAIMNRGKVIAEDDLTRLRNIDFDTYLVEFEITERLPDYVDIKMKSPNTIKGQIPAEKLSQFIRFAEESNLKVYECLLKKATLEDTFLTILEGED
jgi:ABC-2 type transport system ATP-binding protein